MKNITLTLYAFHLKQGLGDSPAITQTQGSQLWESVVTLSRVYPFPELQTLKARLISYRCDPDGHYTYDPAAEAQHPSNCLTPHHTEIQLSKIPTSHGFPLTGELEPYLLHDTYCLTLTLNPADDWKLDLGLSDLEPFYPHHLIQNITADLGKVLIFYGEPDDELDGQTRQSAEKWAQALCQNTGLTPHFKGELRLFGCPGFCFEAEGLTLWILLAEPHQFDGEQFTQYAPIFRELLRSFVKIKKINVTIQESYQSTNLYYEKLEAKVQEFYQILHYSSKTRLNQLEQMVQSIPQDLLYYHCCLRDLKTHQTTIKTNIHNFKIALGKLIAVDGNEFQLWLSFAEKKCPHILQQVELYLDYLEPGKDLFTDLISTIRATTAIEQAKGDRALEHQIQAVGIGITAGAIVASSSGLIVQPKTERVTLGWISLHPMGWAVLASVVCALGSWLVAKRVLGRRSRR